MTNSDIKVLFQAKEILKKDITFSPFLEMAAFCLTKFIDKLQEDFEDSLKHDQDPRERI